MHSVLSSTNRKWIIVWTMDPVYHNTHHSQCQHTTLSTTRKATLFCFPRQICSHVRRDLTRHDPTRYGQERLLTNSSLSTHTPFHRHNITLKRVDSKINPNSLLVMQDMDMLCMQAIVSYHYTAHL